MKVHNLSEKKHGIHTMVIEAENAVKSRFLYCDRLQSTHILWLYSVDCTEVHKPKLSRFFPHIVPSFKILITLLHLFDIDPHTWLHTRYTRDFTHTFLPGYFSYRNTRTGSWFIQCLVEVLVKYNWCEDVNTMMTRVNRKVALGAIFTTFLAIHLSENMMKIFTPKF